MSGQDQGIFNVNQTNLRFRNIADSVQASFQSLPVGVKMHRDGALEILPKLIAAVKKAKAA